jgi:hypothetical protein
LASGEVYFAARRDEFVGILEEDDRIDVNNRQEGERGR